ncbi:MAG: AraC family transcriptional regulator, partial [Terracidiphilus sp.]
YYESYSGTVEAFQRQEKALQRLRPLFNFLEENCGNSIQIKQAAKICRMSESHFMSVFKEVTGMSFLKYLNYYRIEKAQLMLAHADVSMKNLCQEVGFCDQSYFGMVFRKTVGMTPAEYRRRYRANAAPAPPPLSPRLRFEDVRQRLSNNRKKTGCFTGIENSESQSAGPSLALVV